MKKPARRIVSVLIGLAASFAATVATLAPAGVAAAQGLYDQPKYAAIVVDAASGEVLYARRADQPRYPASITKIMTLYLVFDQLAAGKLSVNDQVVVSKHAFGQAPSKVSSHAGETLTVGEAIQAVTVHSANDIAVALAEKVGGTESRFAALMTLRAQELGMTNTRFVNANGLPDTRQITTARDIAILSRAILRDFPQYYAYFGQKSFDYRGRMLTNHNGLLHTMPGVDGIKTGFTNAAGFNLAASAARGGQRLIAVVLGGTSTTARNGNVEELLNAGFDVLTKRKSGETLSIATELHEPDDVTGLAAPALAYASAQPDAALRGAQAAAAPVSASGPTAWLRQASLELGQGPVQTTTLKENALALASESAEECSTVRRSVIVAAHGRGRHRVRAHTVIKTATVCRGPKDDSRVAQADKADLKKVAAVDCDAKVAKAKTRRAKTRARTACRTEERQALAAAKAAGLKTAVKADDSSLAAADCDAKADKARTRRAKTRAHAACKETLAKADKAGKTSKSSRSEAQVAGLKGGQAADDGHYRIQVGAFPSQTGARDHLAKLVQHYAVVASASSQVESGAHGAYRARFSGFSADSARAACKALAAKGEPCMVVAPS